MILEGYQFANGQLDRLTRTQANFLSHVFSFRMEMRYGKKGKRRGGAQTSGKVQRGAGLSGTPEQIHEKMWPKHQKRLSDGRQWEIDNAQKAIRAWEESGLRAKAEREQQQTKPRQKR